MCYGEEKKFQRGGAGNDAKNKQKASWVIINGGWEGRKETLNEPYPRSKNLDR